MKAFFKTLFGDWINLSVVAVIVATAIGLVHTSLVHQSDLAIPPLVLASVGWLAMR